MPDPFSADELALLAGIHADPRSDLPRLVWADWLDDHGDPAHAELIRLQCVKPYIRLTYTDPFHPDRYLPHHFDDHGPATVERLGRLCELLPAVYDSARYARQRELRFAEEHVRGLPVIHVKTALPPDGTNPPWGDIGHLSRVSLYLVTEDLTPWPDSPGMDRVSELHVQKSHIGSPRLVTARALWRPGVAALAASPLPDRLEALVVYDIGPRDSTVCRHIERLLGSRVEIDFQDSLC